MQVDKLNGSVNNQQKMLRVLVNLFLFLLVYDVHNRNQQRSTKLPTLHVARTLIVGIFVKMQKTRLTILTNVSRS